MLLNKMHGIDAGYRKPEKRSCSFYEPCKMSPNQRNGLTQSWSRKETVIVVHGVKMGKKNTLYLIERVSYDTALFSAISLALMLVIHCH